MGAYASAKEAIRGLTRVAAREWGREGINVNCICPSMLTIPGMDSRKQRGMVTDYSSRPIPRAGQEDDAGRVVAFLASDDANYVTGETIMVDGGRSMSGGR
jgi:NAD(P)-dependent dehydrogenase (short-subunit alcohol dehydrogenase family)